MSKHINYMYCKNCDQHYDITFTVYKLWSFSSCKAIKTNNNFIYCYICNSLNMESIALVVQTSIKGHKDINS